MELTIEKLIYGGDGLSRLPADANGRGKAVFVPFVLEGERIEAALTQEKAGFARGELQKIVQPSSLRTPPSCPYFASCGGCHYQHSSYEHQLEIKASILKENLRRIAKLDLQVPLQIHPSPPWNYRNRTRLRLQTAPEFALGYYRFGSHILLPVEECPISSPLINKAIRVLWALGRTGSLDGKIREVEFFANDDDSQLLVEIYSSTRRGGHAEKKVVEFPADLADKTISSTAWALEFRNLLPEAAGIAFFVDSETSGEKAGTPPGNVIGTGELNYKTDHGTYRVSAGSFFQTNRHLVDKLVEVVTAGRSGKTALDLFAGVGLFSTVLSREFEHVVAVESSQHSAADLKYNAAANVRVARSTVEKYLDDSARKLRPDFVVVDPPRAGLGEKAAGRIVSLGAKQLTYVSCDPATLSRDLVSLIGGGYKVQEAHLLDLFPQTFHMETVLHLARN